MDWTFVLGAKDAEMKACRYLLEAVRAHNPGITIEQGRFRGIAVGSSSAYSVDNVTPGPGQVWIECGPAPTGGFSDDERGLASSVADVIAAGAISIDHHADSTPQTHYPPPRAFEGSSIGQLYAFLVENGLEGWRDYREPLRTLASEDAPSPDVEISIDRGPDREPLRFSVPRSVYYIGVGDHCPAAAYRGLVPGVDVQELFEFRCRFKASDLNAVDVAIGIDTEYKDLMASPRMSLLPTIMTHGAPIADGDVTWDLDGTVYVGDPSTSVIDLTVKDARRWYYLRDVAMYYGVAYLLGGRENAGKNGYYRSFSLGGQVSLVQMQAFLAWAQSHRAMSIMVSRTRGYAGCRMRT